MLDCAYPLWLIPVLPLAGFVLNGLVALATGWLKAQREREAWVAKHGDGHHHTSAPEEETLPGNEVHAAHDDHGSHASEPLPRWQRLFHGVVGVGSVGLAAVLSFGVLVPYLRQLLRGEEVRPIVERAYTWMAAGGFSIDVAFRLDTLSAVMLSFVTFVGTLIHVYSVGYMQTEQGFGRFFAYLNLFMFAMLTLVLGANLPMLFIGWEGVGLCSYLLIGYYYTTDFAPPAGRKAFVANRVGDLGMVLGTFGVFALFGTTDFSFLDMAKQQAILGGAPLSVYAVCCLLFLGACGKSAQVPLYVWLPDAMAGPTPVSALIHAATMVTAGVYLVARCSALFVLAPDALTLVAWVGAGTALFAATIGLAQNDIKKVLAYSTVSQLGYMFLACGVGAFSAGIFHVFTHAFFKACLFLGSGSVIMAMHHEQDMRKMGGLKDHIKVTFLTMAIATYAIAGLPPAAGFFSKDLILGSTFATGHLVLYAVGLFTAGMTAFYMTRLLRMTFFGPYRGDPHTGEHIHESPATMTVPLMILAALSVVAGFVGLPGKNLFARILEPSLAPVAEHEVSHALEYGLMALSVAVALTGIVIAWRRFGGEAEAPELQGRLGRLIADKWNVDEGIERLILNPFKRLGTFLWKGFDNLFIDGIVNASAFLIELTGDLVRFFTTGNVRNYALSFSLGVLALLVYVFTK